MTGGSPILGNHHIFFPIASFQRLKLGFSFHEFEPTYNWSRPKPCKKENELNLQYGAPEIAYLDLVGL